MENSFRNASVPIVWNHDCKEAIPVQNLKFRAFRLDYNYTLDQDSLP